LWHRNFLEAQERSTNRREIPTVLSTDVSPVYQPATTEAATPAPRETTT
jgi:hypothetical protein